ncbi:MAG: hypothetical protein HWE22_14420 [Flavobacteriales bacterium]|nr:hypothetical protein [Flavobacteriales bacterium]
MKILLSTFSIFLTVLAYGQNWGAIFNGADSLPDSSIVKTDPALYDIKKFRTNVGRSFGMPHTISDDETVIVLSRSEEYEIKKYQTLYNEVFSRQVLVLNKMEFEEEDYDPETYRFIIDPDLWERKTLITKEYVDGRYVERHYVDVMVKTTDRLLGTVYKIRMGDRLKYEDLLKSFFKEWDEKIKRIQ